MKRYMRSSISDISVKARMGLAESSNDPAILAKLADDDEWEVRQAVAEHTSDLEILEKLAKDVNRDVRDTATKHIAKLANNKSDLSDSWPDADWWYNLSDESFEDAWQNYLSAPEDEVNSELQIFPEPSVQGSMGGLFVYDGSGQDRKEEDDWYIDRQDYLDWQVQAAATSKNAAQYKQKYRKFMKEWIQYLCGI